MDFAGLAAAAAARVAARGPVVAAADDAARPTAPPLTPFTQQHSIQLLALLKLWRTRLPPRAPAAADLIVHLEPSLELTLVRHVAPLLVVFANSARAPPTA